MHDDAADPICQDSFEILPYDRGEKEASILPLRVRLTVACSPQKGIDYSVEVATRLRALKHSVTLHLSARLVRDRAHIEKILESLAVAGIDEIFLVGGDVSLPKGPYSSALSLLSLIHEHPLRPRRIGVAGYPEGHPLIDTTALNDALKEKSQLAEYIVTQLCFHPRSILTWIEQIRDMGVALPVAVGVPGIVDRRKLFEIAVRIGVGPSLAFLKNQGGIGKLMQISALSVERLHAELRPLIGAPDLAIKGFHYFTFNRLLETWQWTQAQSATPVSTSSA